MKAKELKDFLASVPDDADVCCEDIEGKCIGILSADYFKPVMYLTSAQLFPDGWYAESGLELSYEFRKKYEL